MKPSTKMGLNIKDSSKMDLNTGRDKYTLTMGQCIKGNLKTTTCMDMENTTKLMIVATKGIGRIIKCMARVN